MSVNIVKAKRRFSTVVMWDGELITIQAEAGEELNLAPEIVEIVNRDTRGALAKPKTAKGATKTAKTRQVTKSDSEEAKE